MFRYTTSIRDLTSTLIRKSTLHKGKTLIQKVHRPNFGGLIQHTYMLVLQTGCVHFTGSSHTDTTNQDMKKLNKLKPSMSKRSCHNVEYCTVYSNMALCRDRCCESPAHIIGFLLAYVFRLFASVQLIYAGI